MKKKTLEFDEKRYQTIRSMIRHEDDLISSRTGWMVACQALLITSIGLGDFDFFPSILVCGLGIVVSFQSQRNLRYAEDAIYYLKNLWSKDDRSVDPNFPDVIGLRGDGDERISDLTTPPVKQAWAFFVFWIILAIYYCAAFAYCQGVLPALAGWIECAKPE